MLYMYDDSFRMITMIKIIHEKVLTPKFTLSLHKKMKFSMKDIFSLKKSLMGNFILCAMYIAFYPLSVMMSIVLIRLAKNPNYRGVCDYLKFHSIEWWLKKLNMLSLPIIWCDHFSVALSVLILLLGMSLGVSLLATSQIL